MPPPEPTPDVNVGTRAWRKYRSWPLWAQILIGVVIVAIAAAPFTSSDTDDSAASGTSTTASLDDDDDIVTSTTAKQTTTTERPTTTTTTTAPTTTTTEPPPEPIVIEGSGDAIQRVAPVAPSFVTVTHSGSSNIQVVGFDAAGERLGGLVNDIGNYSGQVILDDWRDIDTLDITADGSWRMEILPLSAAPQADLNAGFAGRGDSVRFIGAAGPARFTHNGESNFQVVVFDEDADRRGGAVNEIGPYEGTARLDSGGYIQITADGDWTVGPG